LGKTPNYDQNGKLKNQTLTSKYAGELELRNILDDQNWQKIGACEISCIGVIDHATGQPDIELQAAINAEIKTGYEKGIKPKSDIEKLKEQNEALMARLEKLEAIKPIESSDKELREQLFTEAKELGLNPAKNVKTDILKDLITKAKSLN